MSTQIIEANPAVHVCGVTIPHNTQLWRVATNRHTTTRGNYWGWIEGAPGNVCWSDDAADGKFNRTAALEAVSKHNQWLEDQKPKSIRLIEINEKIERAWGHATASRKRADEAQEELDRLISAREAIKEAQP